MAQQINLYSPILLTPKRYFSAQAMLYSLLVLALGLGVVCAWSVFATHGLRRDLASATQAAEQEKQQLSVELGHRPPVRSDTTALEQELAQAQKALADGQKLLAEMTPSAADAEHSNSAVLQLIAQTVPAAVWLTEVRRADGRLELSGMTVQPETLQPWLNELSLHPALAGQALRAMKVERSETPTPGGAEAWSFHVVSGGPIRDPS